MEVLSLYGAGRLPASACPIGQVRLPTHRPGAGRALANSVSGQPHSPNKGDTYQARLLYTARAYLSRMTLDEKLGQMFLIETSGPSYDADVDTMVRNSACGSSHHLRPEYADTRAADRVTSLPFRPTRPYRSWSRWMKREVWSIDWGTTISIRRCRRPRILLPAAIQRGGASRGNSRS